MSYRDPNEFLRAYRDRVAGDLEDARRAAKAAGERAETVKVLERELAETEGLLTKADGKRRALTVVDQPSVSSARTKPSIHSPSSNSE